MFALFRTLGWILLLPAAIVAGLELSILAETTQLRLYSLGELWYEMHPRSLTALRMVLEQHVSATLWDKVMAPMLLRQAILVFALPGLILAIVPWLIDQLRHGADPAPA
jgi:hypothetical protein